MAKGGWLHQVPWGLLLTLLIVLVVAAAYGNLLLAGTFVMLAAFLELLLEFGKSRNLLPGNEWVVRALYVGLLMLFLGMAERGYIPLVALTGVEPIDVAITAAISSAVAVLTSYGLNYLLQHKLGLPGKSAGPAASEWVE